MKRILLISLFITFKTLAQENIDKAQEVSQILEKNTYEPNYFAMILGLFFVVGLIYLTGYFYQKLTKVNFKNDNLFLNKAQIISTTSLGQGRNLHVVKIGNNACLIGSTQNNITYIKDIELQKQKEEQNNDKNS